MAIEPAEPVDLTTCDREPIHIIGRIQSFGWLLSFTHDWTVNHASDNTATLIGRFATDLIGRSATEFLSADVLEDLRSRLQLLDAGGAAERMFEVDLIGDGRLFDLARHRTGGSLVLECEASERGRRSDHVTMVRPMIDRLRQHRSIADLCEAGARQMRALSGFDRVMIYRFDAIGAGEVIAESTTGDHGSYLGQHFPASDIPQQARALYVRNLLRIISDIDDPTVPIVPVASPDGEPLDLSMSGLRAVSPIHIEYLKNMGVGASMSVSLLRRGKLWGLIACHHYAPLRLDYSLRTSCELFGEFFAYLLDQVEADQDEARRAHSRLLHDQIMAQIAGGGTLLSSFDQFAETIRDVIPYDGIAGWIDGKFIARGTTPDQAQVTELARFLDTIGEGAVWATDRLVDAHKPGQAYIDCCAGILALPVSRVPRDYILLFRKEWSHGVAWAGNPEKTIESGPNGDRLSPRKSFEIWTEERRDQSRPWLAEEIAIAEGLRITLLEVVLRLADAAYTERKRASAQQDLLIAELNHRVRNILGLIRGLITQSSDSAETVDGFADLIGQRIYALARAHDQMTQTRWTPSSLKQLIQTEGAAYLGDQPDRIAIAGPDATIIPTAFTPLALVFHELMTNSCKYGALSVPGGRVAVTIVADPDRSLVLSWRESGGPHVTAPTRRGLGSTIIEQTIPHELGGEAAIEFEPAGLSARFVLPAANVAEIGNPEAALPKALAGPHDGRPDVRLTGEALVVEDNMIIAMEAEDILTELGATRCHVAGSVDRALSVLTQYPVEFALLDINLGPETSEAVAEELLRRRIPFIFASGYGDGMAFNERLVAVPVATKPFTPNDIRTAIRDLG